MTKRSSRIMNSLSSCLLVLTLGIAAAPMAGAREYDDGGYDEPADRAYRYERRTETRTIQDDDPYVFSTIRMVNDWDAPAALKVPMLPVAFVVDIVFLPAEVIADAVR